MSSSEDHAKMEENLLAGKPVTDEGPHFYDSFWKTYEGGVKGKLGGATIGAIVGAVIGVIAIAAMTVASGGAIPAAAMTIIGALSFGGLAYGAHDFNETGKISSGIASGLGIAEKRGAVKFAEIRSDIDTVKNDLKDVKSALGIKTVEAAAPIAVKKNDSPENSETYRTQHMKDMGTATQTKPVFWNIAAIGTVVGLIAGALLAVSGGAGHMVDNLGPEAAKALTGIGGSQAAGLYVASMATMGLFGASFGINRDIFKKIFDKTDLLFKGIIGKVKSIEPALAATPEVTLAPVKTIEVASTTQATPISTIVYESSQGTPQSDTFFRDRVLASKHQVLLNMEHTKSVCH